MRTWKAELAVVTTLLGFVAIASGGGPLELLGATAVVLTFGHAQVADRLAERDAARARPAVSCHRWATRYLVGKEALWCLYFVMHGSWSALAGVVVFLAYPVWRRLWRHHHPMMAIVRFPRAQTGSDGIPRRGAEPDWTARDAAGGPDGGAA